MYHIYNNCVIRMKQSRGNFAAEKLIMDVNYDKKNDSERDCHVNGYGYNCYDVGITLCLQETAWGDVLEAMGS